MSHTIKAIIFDQDGTLYDTEKLYFQSWIEAGKILGVPLTWEFGLEVCGVGSGEIVTLLKNRYPGINGWDVIDLCFEICIKKQDTELEEKPGLHEIFNFCKEQGLKIAIASGSPPAQIEKNIKKVGLQDYVSYIISGLNVPNGKPHPDIFLNAAEHLGLSPEECIVIEDSFSGIRAGHAAGCTTIMIPDKKEPTKEILELCDVRCKDFFEAMEYIKNLL